MNSQVRALYAACERVPGPSSPGSRLAHLITAFSAHLEADGLSLKSEELAHIQKLGTARMMRVPAPEGGFIERASAFQRALKRQLEGDAYDLVHVTDVWAGAVAAQHKEQAELVLVTDLQELPTQTLAERVPELVADDRIKNVIRRGEQLALTRSNALVVCGQAARTAAIAAGAKAETVHVVPHGMDPAVFFASSIELRLHDGFTVLYAGAPVVGRGLAQFLQAVKQLPAGVFGVLWRARPKEPAAEEAVAQAGLTDRILWQDASTQAKLASIFQQADVVVVLPTGTSGTLHGAHIPRRLVEAMMCKRAVVASDTDGVREVVQDRQNGLIIPQKDGRALAAALQLLHQDAALRNRLSQRASETAGEFTWGQRLLEYAHLYEKLLDVPLNIPDPRKGQGSAATADRNRPRGSPAGVGIMRDEVAASAAARAQKEAKTPSIIMLPTPVDVPVVKPVKETKTPSMAAAPPVGVELQPPRAPKEANTPSIIISLAPEPQRKTPSLVRAPPSAAAIEAATARQQEGKTPSLVRAPPSAAAIEAATARQQEGKTPSLVRTPPSAAAIEAATARQQEGKTPSLVRAPPSAAAIDAAAARQREGKTPSMIMAPTPVALPPTPAANMVPTTVTVPPPVFMDSSKMAGSAFPSAAFQPAPPGGRTGTPSSPFVPQVTSPELVMAPVPERWSFNPSSTAVESSPPVMRGTLAFGEDSSSSQVFETRPTQLTAAQLNEPTPMNDSVTSYPVPPENTEAGPNRQSAMAQSEAAAASDGPDVWGGDTVAVDQPPSHMELTPSPDSIPPEPAALPPNNPFQVVPATPQAGRGPLGMRSLALLEAVGGNTPSPDAGPSVEETERLELSRAGSRNPLSHTETTTPGTAPSKLKKD